MERCLQRAQAVYDEVALVDTFSRIKVNGESLKIIRIEMPKLEDEQGRAMTALYLENCIEEIGKLKDEGNYDPAKNIPTVHLCRDIFFASNSLSTAIACL